MRLRTPLTDRLGVALPIIGAPMAGAAFGALARAVTEGGGLGMIGVGSSDSVELIAREAPVASAGGRLPFGIGLMAWALDNRPELLQEALAARPTLVSVSFGPPGPYVSALHEAGIVVASQVQSTASAVAAAESGVDIIVAQGTDAGGHTGTVGTLPLLQLVLDAVDVPVVAAGGIATARGVAGVLAAGAAGAWIGTCLLTCPEAAVADGARAKVLAADETDTVLTRVFDVAQGIGWPEPFAGRALRNRFTEAWHGHEAALAADPAAGRRLTEARNVGDYDTAYIYAGQAVGLVRQSLPAAEVVRHLGEGAASLLVERLHELCGDDCRPH
ncbi:MAG: nitronate monooxygenase [Actinomycetota bacterium]|jgi:nitronate monooxygenase|nr:nitronate monooxygenase [Actinomycetota bacterium]